MASLQKLPIQIIGPSTLKRARQAYNETWNREWPHGDSLLAELVVDAKDQLDLAANSKARPKDVQSETLVLMRLDHEF